MSGDGRTNGQRNDEVARESLAQLLHEFRARDGRSQHSVAHEAGLNSSYLNRVERGERDAPFRSTLMALTRALHLTEVDQGRLAVAAGYAPDALLRYGTWDDTLETVLLTLTDPRISHEEKRQYATMIRQIAHQFRARRHL